MAPEPAGEALMSVCLIDTTVFCNVVPVPGRDQHKSVVLRQMEDLIGNGASLLLPVAAIIETGNHIARCRHGSIRRDAAARFVRTVTQAINGETPFTPTRFFEPEAILEWLADFPESAMRGIGLADLSIVKEFERQCALHPHRRVLIWSLDRHLSSYDRPVSTPPRGR